MSMAQSLVEAIEKLYHYQKGNAGSFMTALFDTMGKADMINLERLRGAFPLEVRARELWMEAPNEKEFFKLHLGKNYYE